MWIVAGLALICLSFLNWVFPVSREGLAFFHSVFYVSNIVLFEAVCRRCTGKSILLRGLGVLPILLLVVLTFGFGTEIYTRWFGKLFSYQYWGARSFMAVFLPGYFLYSLYLLESVVGSIAIGRRILDRKNYRGLTDSGLTDRRVLTWLFTGVGILCTTLFAVATAKLLGLAPIPDVSAVLFASRVLPAQIGSFGWLVAAIVSCWVFLESLGIILNRRSIFASALAGDFVPLLGLMGASLIQSLVYEFFNLRGELWHYVNFPFQEVGVFGVPILAFVVFWPLHMAILFALYSVFSPREVY